MSASSPAAQRAAAFLSTLEVEGRRLEIEIRLPDHYVNATRIGQIGGDLRRFSRFQETKKAQELVKLIRSRSEKSALGSGVGSSFDSGSSNLELVLIDSHKPIDQRFTWIHPDLAVPYVEWVAPAFHLAVSQHIQAFMSGRVTTEDSQAVAAAVRGVSRTPRSEVQLTLSGAPVSLDATVPPNDERYVFYVRLFNELVQLAQRGRPSDNLALTMDLFKFGIAASIVNRQRGYGTDNAFFGYTFETLKKEQSVLLESIGKAIFKFDTEGSHTEYVHRTAVAKYFGKPANVSSYEEVGRTLFCYLVGQAHKKFPELRTCPRPFGQIHTLKAVPSVRSQLATGTNQVAGNASDLTLVHNVVDGDLDSLPEYAQLYPDQVQWFRTVEMERGQNLLIEQEREKTKREVARGECGREIAKEKEVTKREQQKLACDLFREGKISFDQLRMLLDNAPRVPSVTLPPEMSHSTEAGEVGRTSPSEPPYNDISISPVATSTATLSSPSASNGKKEQAPTSSVGFTITNGPAVVERSPKLAKDRRGESVPGFVFVFIDEWIIATGREDDFLTVKSILEKFDRWCDHNLVLINNKREDGRQLLTEGLVQRGYCVPADNVYGIQSKKVDGNTVKCAFAVRWNPQACWPAYVSHSKYGDYIVQRLCRTDNRSDRLVVTDVHLDHGRWRRENGEPNFTDGQSDRNNLVRTLKDAGLPIHYSRKASFIWFVKFV